MNSELDILIHDALNSLYRNDFYLIENNVCECSCVFRFGIYFEKLLKNNPNFSNYNLDAEYNRYHNDVKRTENFDKGTRPDVILHKRGSDGENIVIIEFKGYWNSDYANDFQKLKDFTNPNGKYKYKLGIFVKLNIDKPELTYFKNGAEVKNEQ